MDSANSVSGLSPHKMADVTLPSIRSFIPAPILVVCSRLSLSASLSRSYVGLTRNEKRLYPFRHSQLARIRVSYVSLCNPLRPIVQAVCVLGGGGLRIDGVFPWWISFKGRV